MNYINCAEPWGLLKVWMLEGYWASSLSAAEIGAILGVSKNAVIGKAHRLGLPLRPSPIPAKPPVAPRITLGNVAPDLCLWIEGEPCGANTEVCGAANKPGSDYCPTHHAKVYVKKVVE